MSNKKNTEKWDFSLSNMIFPFIMLAVFIAIALWTWLSSGYIFYLFNFLYIGISVFLGIFLSTTMPKSKKPWGRRITQFLVGIYMLGFLGFVNSENMQIEGFFGYLFLGIFAGATLHYFIAKIAGPIIFNRAWCGWACWTAMILDLLPYKKPKEGRLQKFGAIRYLHFFISLGIVLFTFFILSINTFKEQRAVELYWLIIGNIIYYAIGIILAFVLKDNRAFCKYVCPIPTLQKITARFSLLKIKIDNKKCIDCKLCEKNCPMNIKLLSYKNEGKRILSSECILCNTCADICPKDAVKMSVGLDFSFKEKLFF